MMMMMRKREMKKSSFSHSIHKTQVHIMKIVHVGVSKNIPRVCGYEVVLCTIRNITYFYRKKDRRKRRREHSHKKTNMNESDTSTCSFNISKREKTGIGGRWMNKWIDG